MSKKILVLGSGGREDAIAWKLSLSEKVSKIYVAPGNGGTASLNKCSNLDIPLKKESFFKLIDFAKVEDIDLTIVGPDDALADGIVDLFEEAGLKVFGPNYKAAEIESSKAFSKELMRKANIPTAAYEVFSDYESACAYVKDQGKYPVVVKASGLALGKGVNICQTEKEAMDFIQKIFIDKIFGKAGNEVLIEEFLKGHEISIHAFCDGKSAMLFPAAQDHKAIYENDQGPNTGGMGTIAPLPWLNSDVLIEVSQTIVLPILKAMADEGRIFKGLLYPGLIMTDEGPKVLEFNARFGDPETQSYMRLLESDLFDILEACADSRLEEIDLQWSQESVATVILASDGYPKSYEKGFEISGISEAEEIEGVTVFHAGTLISDDGKLVTNGGRVLTVSALAKNLETAIEKAYFAADKIDFKGKYIRRDIGAKALKFEAIELKV